jgi:hypothetical protein
MKFHFFKKQFEMKKKLLEEFPSWWKKQKWIRCTVPRVTTTTLTACRLYMWHELEDTDQPCSVTRSGSTQTSQHQSRSAGHRAQHPQQKYQVGKATSQD